MLVKQFIIHANANKKTYKKKVVEERKTDIKGIFKTFQDLSKKEIERSKKLYNDHFSFFEENQPEVAVVLTDDEFFENKKTLD